MSRFCGVALEFLTDDRDEKRKKGSAYFKPGEVVGIVCCDGAGVAGEGPHGHVTTRNM